jgi:sensor c-di-GMP phosphodiesterase-like protein
MSELLRAILRKVETSLLLFRLIQALPRYEYNVHYQPIKKMYIYSVLMNKEADNMGLVP